MVHLRTNFTVCCSWFEYVASKLVAVKSSMLQLVADHLEHKGKYLDLPSEQKSALCQCTIFYYKILIYFYSSLIIPFTISLFLIIMTLQFILILCSCMNSAKLSFISYLLCLHPPYLSFSLSLTTYRNTSQDKGEYDSGTEHYTNTIRVQMVRLRLVIRLVLNASPLPIQTLRSPWHQVIENLVSLLRGQLD